MDLLRIIPVDCRGVCWSYRQNGWQLDRAYRDSPDPGTRSEQFSGKGDATASIG